MQRRYKRLLVATAITAFTAGPAAAQQPGIFGTFNPTTGHFQPAPVQMVTSGSGKRAAAEATAARSGVIRVVVTIVVKNTTASSVLPNCYIGISHSTGSQYYSNSQSVQGTRVADTGKCIAVINYKWPSANTVAPVNISISANVGSWGASVAVEPILLPANGATTVVNASTVL
jgi:hypothetical protein